MSQYPPTYPPPPQQPSPYGAPPIDFSQYVPYGQPDLIGPARRAGALMMVLGALLAMFGACNGGSSLLRSPEDIAKQQATIRAAGLPESPMKPETMRIAGAVAGGLTLLVGVAFLVNGVYVRRASGAAITVGIVLAGGVTALVGLLVLMCLLTAVAMPMVLGFACVLLVPLGLLGWLDVWLIQAARNNAQVNALRTQYQAQFAGYGQQYPGYAPGPYGYGYPPQPPGYGYPAAPPPAAAGPGTSAWPSAPQAPVVPGAPADSWNGVPQDSHSSTQPLPPGQPQQSTSEGQPAQQPSGQHPQAQRPPDAGGSDVPPTQL